MKIVFTIADATHAAHIGCDVERKSAIIEVSEDQIPALVKGHFAAKKWAKEGPNRYVYETLSLSYIEEETTPPVVRPDPANKKGE